MYPSALIPFFLLTYAITWGLGAFAIFFPGPFRALLGELSDTHPLYYVAVAAPTISATILTLAREGWSGLGALYARLIQWRLGIQWYAVVLLGVPALGLLATLIATPTPLKDISTPRLLLLLLLNMLVTGPLGEELGWRGFALPRLLKRSNPLVASLILGAIWGVWHLPSFFLSGMVQAGQSIPLFLLSAVATSVLVTWVFQHTGGSVFITVLFHYMFNLSVTVLGAPLAAMALLMLVCAVLVVVLDRRAGWFQKA